MANRQCSNANIGDLITAVSRLTITEGLLDGHSFLPSLYDFDHQLKNFADEYSQKCNTLIRMECEYHACPAIASMIDGATNKKNHVSFVAHELATFDNNTGQFVLMEMGLNTIDHTLLNKETG
eukprot:392751_1